MKAGRSEGVSRVPGKPPAFLGGLGRTLSWPNVGCHPLPVPKPLWEGEGGTRGPGRLRDFKERYRQYRQTRLSNPSAIAYQPCGLRGTLFRLSEPAS